MTTVVADFTAGIMVSDSQVSDGDQKWSAQKIERVGRAIVGCAGDCASIERFMRWRRAGMRGGKPKLGDDFCALEINEDGLWLWDRKLERFPPGRSFHAIGSGAKAATVAIMLGCDAKRAVELACEVDDGSSLPLQVLTVAGS
jgi:hypothetical protein